MQFKLKLKINFLFPFLNCFNIIVWILKNIPNITCNNNLINVSYGLLLSSIILDCDIGLILSMIGVSFRNLIQKTKELATNFCKIKPSFT